MGEPEIAHTRNVACRAVATQRQPFLGNGSVNTFPQSNTNATMAQKYKSYIFCVVRAEML
jgi:hypothetical protein